MSKENRQAVIIGVNDYKDPKIPKLFGAVNDATEVRTRLSDFGGFEISEDHFLLNARANSEAIRKAISDLFWKDDSYELALFYFSGHGFSDGYNDGYIAPYDMLSNEPYVSGINMEELKKLIMRSVNKQCALVILDCCFSGISTKGERALPDHAITFDSYFSDLAKGGEGKIIIASSGEDQKSRETDQEPIHGLFTSYLIEGLDGMAADEAGIITLDRLYHHIEDQLTSNGKQKPQFYAASTSQWDNILIAKATDQFENFIMEKLNGAKEKISKNQAFDLIDAITDVQNVLEKSNDHKQAIELRYEIQKSLTNYRDNLVLPWMEENENALRGKEYAPQLLREFQRLSLCLDFESIPKLNQLEKKRLICLCEVSNKEREREYFFRQCRAWSNPSNSIKSG